MIPDHTGPHGRRATTACDANTIEARLRRLGDPARAEGAKRYLKSDLEFIGVTTAQLRAVVGEVASRATLSDRRALLRLVEALWRRPVFEVRAAAVELLCGRVALLQAGDLGFVERLLRESGTWALVDSLAAHAAGDIVRRFPDSAATLDRWAADADFWLRRSALLTLLVPLRRGEGDFERFGRYADAMLDEKEFFIRKAIGWVLREVSKKRPALVVTWLSSRVPRASGVTLREALRYIPENDAARLEALRARSQPAR